MNPTSLRDALSATPFRPFNLYYPSAAIYVVRSPDQAIITADLRTLVIAKADAPDSGGFDMLDAIMIERLKVLSEDPMPPKWWLRPAGPPPKGGLGSDAA